MNKSDTSASKPVGDIQPEAGGSNEGAMRGVISGFLGNYQLKTKLPEWLAIGVY